MFSIFQKLLGLKSREELIPPFILEKPVMRKSAEEVRKEVYARVAGVLYEDAVFSSHSGYDAYPRLKKSLQKVNEIIDNNKESLVVNDSELRMLKEKISNYREEHALSMVTYDVCKLMIKYKYEDISVLNDIAIGRILYWYGL